MKVGILTYHRTLNYGACLQAVATRVVLEKMGHEVYYVDYWPKYHKGKYKLFSWSVFRSHSLRQKLKYLKNIIINHKFILRRAKNFSKFHNKYITPYCNPLNDSYDVVVYGSDQIWRKQKEIRAYNPIYFGDNSIKAQAHISYAASMGKLPVNENDRNRVHQLLLNLDRISVRENDLKDFISRLGFKNVILSLDPTLLLSAQEWNQIIPTPAFNGAKYVLVYGIGRACFDNSEVVKYAKEHDCIVKTLKSSGTANDSETQISTAAPDTFMHLIKNAECIFTSSFHGLAFSIIFQKEFFASFSPNKVSRAESMLTLLNLSERLISPKTSIPSCKKIDYKEVETHLRILQKESIDYLSVSTKFAE